jgi:fumarylacetoacetase
MLERGWVPMPAGSDFTIANLPFGMVELASGERSAAIRVGDHVVVLDRLQATAALDALNLPPRLFAAPSLNAFMALGAAAWAATRAHVGRLLVSTDARPFVEPALVALDDVRVILPIEVGDYVDFYSSLQHATNLGRMFRPDGEPLLANWRHLPVGYHGRAGTCVVSGTEIGRPSGLIADGATTPTLRPTRQLDLELEVGFVVGIGGTRVSPDHAEHV